MPYLAPNPEHIVPVSPAGSSKAVATVMMPPPIDFDDEEEPPRIPTVVLDVDEIADDMAARMATSLLGHVLFLKGQIPFPVQQLARLKGKSNPRATKLRMAFMESFDLLSSHFDSSFSALSTAFARHGMKAPSPLSELRKPKSPRRGYLALLVGPSVGTAKAKVILGLDGLESKVWGLRDDEANEDESEESEEEDELEESEDDEDDAEEPEESESEGEDADEGEVEDEAATSEGEDRLSAENEPPAPAPKPPSPPPSYAFSQTQQALQKAERLLSRALAGSDALANELSPTQTHIMMRAPRRFSHPSWVPMQNATQALENTLPEFLFESGVVPEPTDAKKKPNKKASKVEGVWVSARGGLTPNYMEPEGGTEEDDMIWYAWDGKLVGFADW
ncbi:hypothetical protein FB107DRAFT_293042 [Schizophyllum commune]